MRIGWGLLLSLLVAAGAQASDVADEAEFHFRRGLAYQQRGRSEEALAEFYASNRLVPNRNVQMNIASALGRLGLFDEAFRAYSELEGQALTGEERADVDRALAFLRPKLALVRVDSSPPGAAIFVERRDLGALGTTPKTLALKPGVAKILLDLPGYRPAEAEVRLEKGRQVLAARELERIYGELDFTSLPAAAEVRREGASGEVLQRGPGKLRLVPGRIAVHLSAPGFLPSRLDLDVPADSTRVVDLTLPPEPPPVPKVGALVVRANLDGALVRVDGKEMGFTPVVIEQVLAGHRVVEVTREGREPFTQEVDLADKERRFLDVTLRPKRLEVAGATQRLIRLEDAPASMTVITADEIRAFGYVTVADALRSVRGLHVWSDRAYDSVGVRGFGLPENANARVLVLLNGHPMNDLIRGYGPIGTDLGIDMSQVDRIEVVRGGGMVFGATAYLGLVNVVTRQPGLGVHVQVGLAGESFGGLEGRTAVSSRGDWGEVLGLAGGQAGGGSGLVSRGRLISDEGSSGDLHLFARTGNFSLTAGATERRKTVPTGFAWSMGAPVNQGDGRAFAAVQYDRGFAGGSFVLGRVAVDTSGYSLDYHPPGPDWRTETAKADGFSGEVRFEWAFNANHRLTAGAAGRLLTKLAIHAAVSDDEEVFDLATKGASITLYAIDEWSPRPTVRLHTGFRVDPVGVASIQDLSRPDHVALKLLPHLALIGRPYEGGNTKLLVGATVRGPSQRELKFGHSAFLRQQPGELQQEERLALELEHSHLLTDETTLVGGVFINTYNQIIASGPGAEGTTGLVLGNSPKHTGAVGAELEIRYAPGDGKLASVSGVIQGSTVGGTAELVNFPEHVVSGRFLWPVLGQSLRAGTELVFVGARSDRTGERIDESLYWNVMLSGEHPKWQLTYFGGVFNIIDERLPDPVGPDLIPASVTRSGREVRVGFSRRFGAPGKYDSGARGSLDLSACALCP
ncbi:MAG: PEGA domain-containing protein [Myxococcaceae bacterium]